jgi:hypothetical protein
MEREAARGLEIGLDYGDLEGAEALISGYNCLAMQRPQATKWVRARLKATQLLKGISLSVLIVNVELHKVSS